MFKKAMPKQAWLKFSMYGPPGSGKTFSSLLLAEGLAAACGKRVAYIDTERGTDFYASSVKERKVHPDAFDFDALYTRSLADALEAVRNFDAGDYGALVIDSISHLWEAAIESYSGQMVGKNEDKIPMHAWGSIKRPYKELIDRAMALDCHVILCGRQKNLFEDTDDGMKKVGVGMKAEGETQYEPTICLRMSMSPDGVILMQAEKDRTGIISGRTFSNPTFKVFEPMLSILGTDHHELEDDEERLAKDSELLAEQEEKKAKKGAKSREHLASFQARLMAADSLEDLAEVAAEVKKAKRNIVAEHQSVLRVLYEERRHSITEALSPEAI